MLIKNIHSYKVFIAKFKKKASNFNNFPYSTLIFNKISEYLFLKQLFYPLSTTSFYLEELLIH